MILTNLFRQMETGARALAHASDTPAVREAPPVPEGRLGPLRDAEYRRVWFAAVLIALAKWMERLAVGWLVLDLSGSAFLAALSFAVRVMPNTFVGPIAGAAADRFRRERILMGAALLRFTGVAAISLLVLAGIESVAAILVLVFVTGLTNSFEFTSIHALQGDIVGPARRGSAVSLTQFGQRSVGVVGSLSGGLLIGAVGPGLTFALATIPLATAAMLATRVRPRRRSASGTRFRSDVIEGLAVLIRTPMVRLLLVLMLCVEILGFSYNSMLPVVADEILGVGPAGLGLLTSGAAFGAIGGSIAMLIVADHHAGGMLLLGVYASFGALLLVLAGSTTFAISLLAVAGIGASATMVDALEWILLQASVDDRLRGRALGGWNIAVGWGWLGPVTLGAIADVAGVGTALTMSGGLLLTVACVAFLAAPQLRRGPQPVASEI